MATSQHALQSNAESTTIELEHVSVSQLLGRDYVFINAQYVDLPLNNPNVMHNLLDDLIKQLELAETHTVAVSVRELSADNATFIRHDLTWYKHKICRIESIAITQPEQHEFMDMIWRCSTSAVPV